MDIEATIQAMKETLIFLVEQEKVRAEEIEALNKKIDALNETVVNDILTPVQEAFDEEEFRKFDEQYGERLNVNDGIIKAAGNKDDDYSSSRETWNEIKNLPEEERKDLDMEGFIGGVEEGLKEYVDNLKESLGLPKETAVEITADENGEVEVKADEDGDGEPETPVETEETKEEEVSVEDNTTEDEVDPELQKELDEWSKK